MRHFAFALVVLLAATAVHAGEVIGPSKCAAAKFKAGGAHAQALAACRAKAATKGLPVELACETKALAKLQKAFAKAETKDGCIITGNVVLFESQAEAYIANLVDALTLLPVCCNIATGGADSRCGWTLGASACTARGGAVGNEGTECHGAGGCADPPVESGPCCENDGVCEAGTINVSTCTNAGGSYSDDAFCLASGDCAAP